jgi:hypothetical protein
VASEPSAAGRRRAGSLGALQFREMKEKGEKRRKCGKSKIEVLLATWLR